MLSPGSQASQVSPDEIQGDETPNPKPYGKRMESLDAGLEPSAELSSFKGQQANAEL